MSTTRRRYVALVRGVNVGGHSVIKMAELRALFESAGLEDVATYIQSGNVLFSTENCDRGDLETQLEQKLASKIGRQAKVFVLTQDEMRQAVAHNPLDPEGRDKEQRSHLMFLSAEPDMAHREALMAMRGGDYLFHVHDKVFFYSYPRKPDQKRRTIDFEKVLGVTGTSRTWKVVSKLIELLD